MAGWIFNLLKDLDPTHIFYIQCVPTDLVS